MASWSRRCASATADGCSAWSGPGRFLDGGDPVHGRAGDPARRRAELRGRWTCSLRHAEKVLAAFGRAFGTCPRPGETGAGAAAFRGAGGRGPGPGRKGDLRAAGPVRPDDEGPALDAGITARRGRHAGRRRHFPGRDLQRRRRASRAPLSPEGRPGDPQSAAARGPAPTSRGTCDPRPSCWASRATPADPAISRTCCTSWTARCA